MCAKFPPLIAPHRRHLLWAAAPSPGRPQGHFLSQGHQDIARDGLCHLHPARSPACDRRGWTSASCSRRGFAPASRLSRESTTGAHCSWHGAMRWYEQFHPSDRSYHRSPDHDLDLLGRADRYIPDLYDLYDLYDLAHVAGWELYNLLDLARVS